MSDLERGQIGRSEVDTLAAYVAALGGRLKIVADFDDESVVPQ
ncbi:helix-turn-helix domain-containing protein [Streptomyces sp. GXMU-J5]|uniref:Helix-turn-helix domain-containing protein n=1 Tax=Streptomyces beihaiensis TaxID=2984495 RepID=A0ABT3TXD4_9ACTN|nr:helix-turn-helix domain-containing protein [Streptomyces beihaiensis]